MRKLLDSTTPTETRPRRYQLLRGIAYRNKVYIVLNVNSMDLHIVLPRTVELSHLEIQYQSDKLRPIHPSWYTSYAAHVCIPGHMYLCQAVTCLGSQSVTLEALVMSEAVMLHGFFSSPPRLRGLATTLAVASRIAGGFAVERPWIKRLPNSHLVTVEMPRHGMGGITVFSNDAQPASRISIVTR